MSLWVLDRIKCFHQWFSSCLQYPVYIKEYPRNQKPLQLHLVEAWWQWRHQEHGASHSDQCSGAWIPSSNPVLEQRAQSRQICTFEVKTEAKQGPGGWLALLASGQGYHLAHKWIESIKVTLYDGMLKRWWYMYHKMWSSITFGPKWTYLII